MPPDLRRDGRGARLLRRFIHFAAIALIEAWLVAAGFSAGLVNAIAGGGPLLTLATLTAAGLDPRLANLTSTVALSPGQLVAGWSARKSLQDVSTRKGARASLLLLSLCGGAVGGLLLLLTTARGFASIVPWLILFATLLYAWGSKAPDLAVKRRMSAWTFSGALLLSAFYGGYFGGGNSFIVLALLSFAGLDVRSGAAAKNVVIASINLGAVLVFVASGEVEWRAALAVGAGGILGSIAGSRLLSGIRPSALRPVIILCGLLLAGWYFVT